MLKALSLIHFWSIFLLKEQMMTSVRKRLKMLVWSAQNRSISSEICRKNNHKNPRNRPIFREFVPKNPTKFDFFFCDLSEALPSAHVMFYDYLLYKDQWTTKPFHFNSLLVWKARFIMQP